MRPKPSREGVIAVLRLLDLLPIPADELNKYKLHLATRDDEGRDPLIELSNSSFQEWQEWQTRKNFPRECILALIHYNNHDEWLFGGIYRQRGVKKVGDRFRYDTDLLDTGKELIGRLVLSFRRPGRQSYLYLERWAERITVVELARTPLA